MQDRNTIETKYTWDFTHIYENDGGLDADLAACGELTGRLAGFRGRLAESSDVLADAMDTFTAAMEKLERASCYAYLQYSIDGGDPAAQVMMGKTQTAGVALMTAAAFLEPEILEIPEETLHRYLDADRLATYRHFFHDTIRGKAHTLDAKSVYFL